MALRGRRPARGGGPRTTGIRVEPEITSAAGLRERHLLLVPSTTHPEDVADLLRARVPGSDLSRTGEVALGRFSRLTGPYQLSMEDAVDAGVPMPWTLAYAISSPVEREDPPHPGRQDRDGLTAAFPHGLPWREEGRAVRLAISMARRLRGAVRTADGPLIQPDPTRAVDVVVHSDYWLDPGVLLGVVQRVLPGARPAVHGTPYQGPAPDVYSGAALADRTGALPLPVAEQARLHRAADTHDLAVLAEEETIDAFALVAEAGPGDGDVEVRVRMGRRGEPSVADRPWAAGDFVTYEVRWLPEDLAARERRDPPPGHLAARGRLQPLVCAVARAVVEATGGVVTDEDGFWLDRYNL